MFNLSFLNASILALAAATILPLIIHLLARRKPHKVVFSSLRFIRQSIRKQNRRLRLMEILLILTRMAVILFTILAVARPVLKAPFLKSGNRHARTAIAIVLDNSYSMDYLLDTRTDLDAGKEMIKRINGLLTPDDMTTLLTMNRNWNKLNSRLMVGPVPDKLVQGVRISPGTEELKTVLEEADRILAESQLPNREIYLITDGQRQSLPGKTEAPIFVLSTSRLDDKNNQSCQNARVTNDLIDPGAMRKVEFEVVNHSRTARTEVICQLTLDDIVQAEKVVELESGQRLTESFPIRLDLPGWHNGYVEVKNERHVFDNRSYFTTHYDPAPKLALLTDASTLPLPLSALLAMYTGKSGTIERFSDPPELEDLQNYTAVVVYKKTYDGRTRFLLDRLQQTGRGFLWIADRDLGKDWESFASSALGLDLLTFHDGDKTPLNSVNRFHPITSLLDETALRKTSVTDYRSARVLGGDTEVLLGAGGSPIATVRDHCVAWLFDPEGLRTPFLVDPAYPVFGWRCLETISTNAVEDRPLTVGSRVILSGRKLILPDGSPLETTLSAFTLAEPGIYRLDDGTSQKPLSVNLDYAESDFFRFDPKLTKNLRWTGVNWIDEILLTRYGFETWKILLVLVLLLLALEMLIVKRLEKAGM